MIYKIKGVCQQVYAFLILIINLSKKEKKFLNQLLAEKAAEAEEKANGSEKAE